MEDVARAFEALFSLVGPLWFIAWSAAFCVMTFESAAPKRAPQDPPRSALARTGMLASALVVFVLFLHGFGAFILANQGALAMGGAVAPVLALVVVIGILAIGPSLLGAGVAALAPGAGGALAKLSPLLALLVLGFALWITSHNAALVLELYSGSRPG